MTGALPFANLPRLPVSPPAARQGAIAAFGCYLFWGLVPLYWKWLASIDAVELIAHRNVWSLAVLLLLVARQRDGFATLRGCLASPRRIADNLLNASLLTANWLLYVWGVNQGHVVECSLGYYLVPLLNVALGRFVLHERLRPLQWLAIAIAALGVLLLVLQLGTVPWIALSLAATWGAYGLRRKRSPVGSTTGLAVETLLLCPLALGFLLWRAVAGEGALGHVDATTHVLVLASGPITALPLLLFAFGAQRIRLATLGLLQFVSPTVQLLLAILVYDEPFTRERAISFACIWCALTLYSFDSVRSVRSATA